MSYPASPVDGTEYVIGKNRYKYTAADGTYELVGGIAPDIIIENGAAFSSSATAPASPNIGDFWHNTNTNNLMIYDNDGSTSVWRQIS